MAENQALEAEKAALEKVLADKRDKVRLEALKPDKEKLLAWADEVLDFDGPDVESQAAQQIVFAAQSAIDDVHRIVVDAVEKSFT